MKIEIQVELNSLPHSLISNRNIIKEARGKAGCFSSCFFNHVGREGNRVVDTLAKLGLTIDYDMIWVKDCPPCVEQLVITDAILVMKDFLLFSKKKL